MSDRDIAIPVKRWVIDITAGIGKVILNRLRKTGLFFIYKSFWQTITETKVRYIVYQIASLNNVSLDASLKKYQWGQAS